MPASHRIAVTNTPRWQAAIVAGFLFTTCCSLAFFKLIFVSFLYQLTLDIRLSLEMPFKAAISKPSQTVGRELFRAAFKCEGCQGRCLN